MIACIRTAIEKIFFSVEGLVSCSDSDVVMASNFMFSIFFRYCPARHECITPIGNCHGLHEGGDECAGEKCVSD